ncbi:MAG TPA: hypothetical protein VFH78_01880 [Candidatus Thermoplasmatota archaeon]|nr:hypothetical protein [Candidatus Thermoplasmatota archaeon]
MKDRPRRFARLLPDHRTLYVSLEELDASRAPGESDAELLLRSVRFAQRVSEEDQSVREQAEHFLRVAGLPEDDPLSVELALALVVRSRFLREHPQVWVRLREPGETSERG